MITSDKQYKVAQEKLKMLRSSLSAPVRAGVPEVVEVAARGQTKQLADKVEQEMREYKALKDGTVKKIVVHNISEIYTAPIRFRIAKGWTLEQFAKFLGKDWRTILRYEQQEYQNATSSTLKEILEHLHLAIRGSVEVTTEVKAHEKHLSAKFRMATLAKKSRGRKTAD